MKRTIEATCQFKNDYYLPLTVKVVDDYVELDIRLVQNPAQFTGNEPLAIEGDYATYIVQIVDKRASGALARDGVKVDVTNPTLTFQPKRQNATVLDYFGEENHRIYISNIEGNSEENAVRNLVSIIMDNLVAADMLDFAMAVTFTGLVDLANGDYVVDASVIKDGAVVPNLTRRNTVQHLRGALRVRRIVDITQIDDVTRLTKTIKA